MSDTYTAHLIGSDSTETVELEFISGLPQKSFVRPTGGSTQGNSSDDGDEGDVGESEVVWELVPDSDEGTYEYRTAGIPGADYS